MNKKQTIRLNESQFNNLVTKIVTESVKKVLKEGLLQQQYQNLRELSYDVFMPFLTQQCGCFDDEAKSIIDDAWTYSEGLLPGMRNAVTKKYGGNSIKASQALKRWAEENAPQELNQVLGRI